MQKWATIIYFLADSQWKTQSKRERLLTFASKCKREQVA